ncbi:MAG: OmpA family protein, partial [Planctomycetota bacterium]
MPTRRDDRHVAPGRPPGPPKAAPAFTAVRPYGTADPLPAELPPEPVIDPYAGAARVPTPAALPAPAATPIPTATPTPAAMPPPAAMPMPAAVPTPIAVPYPVSTPVP